MRLTLPADVRPAFGNRKILSQSLKTGSRSEAMRLRLPYLSKWKAEIHAVRQQKASEAERWREELHKESESRRAKTDALILSLFSRADSAPPSGSIDISFITKLPLIAEELRELGRYDIIERMHEFFTHYLDKIGSGVSAGEGAELTQKTSEFFSYLESEAYADEFDLDEAEKKEALSIALNPKGYKPKSPITDSMLSAWRQHLETQIDTPKTIDTHITRMQRFCHYLTNEGAPLSFDTVHAFLCDVSSARKTRQQYLWSARTFWKWAIRYHEGFRSQFGSFPSPFEGHELPKVKSSTGDSYTPFTRSELEALHSKALANGDAILANLIQFAAYTGCRLEEIGRLKVEDTIFSADGTPIGFKIPKAKTDAGVRDVPIHDALLPLYVRLSDSSTDGYLFAGGKNKYGNRLDALSKRFGRLKKDGFTELHCFHSIRKTFVSLLHQAGVSIEILPFIVGHESKSFTLDVYSAGPSFEQKREAVNKLKYSF